MIGLALAANPDDIPLRRESLVKEALGLHRHRARHRAGANAFALGSKLKVDQVSARGEGDVVYRRDCNPELTIMVGKQSRQFSDKFPRVIERHRSSALVVVRARANIKYRSLALAADKLSEEHMGAVLASVRYSLRQVKALQVPLSFLDRWSAVTLLKVSPRSIGLVPLAERNPQGNFGLRLMSDEAS